MKEEITFYNIIRTLKTNKPEAPDLEITANPKFAAPILSFALTRSLI